MAKTQKPQAVTRPPWERMMRFHQLVQEESFPDCNVIAKEFEVFWRTIMRDMDFMKCRLKLPWSLMPKRTAIFIPEGEVEVEGSVLTFDTTPPHRSPIPDPPRFRIPHSALPFREARHRLGLTPPATCL